MLGAFIAAGKESVLGVELDRLIGRIAPCSQGCVDLAKVPDLTAALAVGDGDRILLLGSTDPDKRLVSAA